MKNLLYLFFALTILGSCSERKKSLEGSNCIVSKEKTGQLLNGFTPLLASDSTREIGVNFYNNPYNIDSTYSLVLITGNKSIVYKGKFQPYLKIKIPLTTLGKLTEVKFILTSGETSYIFNTMQVARLKEGDDQMQLIFMPDKSDWFTFYFNFCKSGDFMM